MLQEMNLGPATPLILEPNTNAQGGIYSLGVDP